MFYSGCMCAALAGIGMPAIGFLFGDVIDGFGNPDDNTVEFVCIIMVALGFFVWVFCAIYWTLLL